jgi:hypothetical protein
MHTMINDNVTATTQEDKHQLVFDHFRSHISSCSQRTHSLNLEQLNWQPQQLHHLELPFSEQEVQVTISSLPKEKSLGSDGFIGLFFKKCWSIIKPEIMRAINQLYNMNQQGLHYLNQAMVILIPKRPSAERITDFRPINLVHSFAKLLSKPMIVRLAPELKNLISHNQNAFIKKCCIHDNFMLMQQAIKDLHKWKIPSLFIKSDISKAFDMVN